MALPAEVPVRRELSPSMRVDLLVSDWKASVDPEAPPEVREKELYAKVWDAYLEGDHGFGLWCWHECDRLTNNLGGNIREVTRILGPGHYLGFSHRKVLALEVPIEKIYRPRKGDMSTPRPDAFVLPHYQVLCVYLAQAGSGDAKAKALLEIALGELEDRRRADPYLRHFETFRDLLARTSAKDGTPPPPVPPTAAVPAATLESPATSARVRPTARRKPKGT